MEQYRTNNPGCRPYNRTCGMMRRDTPYVTERTSETYPFQKNCNCRMPGTICHNEEMYSHLSHLEPAMAYVPCQKFSDTFTLDSALSTGTIFPELCKPFYGKRGICR